MQEGSGQIQRLVSMAIERFVPTSAADPSDPKVQAFAEFGLPPSSVFATADGLRELETWRENLKIPANSAFLDSTLLLTVDALLGPNGPTVLTPVTLWELAAFIDAMVCFDHLYCIENPAIDVYGFNRRLGVNVLMAVPDPDGGTLRRLAAEAAVGGISNMDGLKGSVGDPDAYGTEVKAVGDGWRAVLGQDISDMAPFATGTLDTWLRLLFTTSSSADGDHEPGEGDELSVELIDGVEAVLRKPEHWQISPRRRQLSLIQKRLGVLIAATRLPHAPGSPVEHPPLRDRERFAANTTYRTYVNQGVANALALPYLPGTLRMPFRRLFVERAAEVQDELVSVAAADKIFASQQPTSPLILPFFTASVLQRARSREDIWTHMAQTRQQSAAFREHRAELDRLLERSQVSPDALRVQQAIRDEGLNLADLAGVAQQSTSVALGVVAQTSILPLAGVIKTGVDAAQGIGRSGSWTRVWSRLFRRHEYFLAQTNSQAIALTNALPQIQQLWQMPKIGAYLQKFADATQQMGHVLRG
jgi:hypothetical protein